MTTALMKSLAALVPIAFLLAGAVLLAMRHKHLPAFLQLAGAVGLVLVGINHVFEALQLLPWIGWGLEGSPGHYIDLAGAMIATTLFPAGYFLQARQVR